MQQFALKPAFLQNFWLSIGELLKIKCFKNANTDCRGAKSGPGMKHGEAALQLERCVEILDCFELEWTQHYKTETFQKVTTSDDKRKI